jgi:hypothetical protein
MYSSSGMGTGDPDAQAVEPRDLIRRAFFAARDSSKKADWYQMTAGVLKNRIRQLTAGSFDEADYSATSFTAFLRAFPDLVEVDAVARPPRVVLKEYAPAENVTAPVKPRRRPGIRPDLWQAVVDFSSGIQYVWDHHAGRARPRNEATAENLQIIPTVTRDELRDWRTKFVASNPLTREHAESPQVKTWIERGLGTSALPPTLRAPWNQEMSRLLEQKLRGWFAEMHLEPPADLVEQAPTEAKIASDLDDLRSIAIEVVTHMTADELRGLSFPSEAVLRALRRRG